jgi:hypothetical protein
MFGFKKRDPLAELDEMANQNNNFDLPPTQEHTGIPPQMSEQQNAFAFDNQSSTNNLETPSTFDKVREIQHKENDFAPTQRSEPSQNQQNFSQNYGNVGNKDLELISSKIDVIKAMIETLSHKVSSLEQKVDSNKRGW